MRGDRAQRPGGEPQFAATQAGQFPAAEAVSLRELIANWRRTADSAFAEADLGALRYGQRNLAAMLLRERAKVLTECADDLARFAMSVGIVPVNPRSLYEVYWSRRALAAEEELARLRNQMISAETNPNWAGSGGIPHCFQPPEP